MADSTWFIEPSAADKFAVGSFNKQNDSLLKATIDKFIKDPNKDNMAAVVYSNYPPLFRKPIAQSQAKGVILLGDDLSSWTVHTLPQFPDMSGTELEYTPRDSKTGIALCLTIKDDVTEIFKVLNYGDAILYYHKAGNTKPPPQYTDSTTQSFLDGTVPVTSPFVFAFAGKTEKKAEIYAIGKYEKISVDTFSRFVARILRTALRVRFNTRVPGVLQNYCIPSTPTSNIGGSITINSQTITDDQDGTVWAVGKTNQFCVGDVSRTINNEKLATVISCVVQPDIYKIFDAVAKTSTPPLPLCPGTV